MKFSAPWDSLPALLRALNLDDSAKKVLIIEDETLLREKLADLLADHGHLIDAREGLERDHLPLSGYDVAFLDNYFISNTLTGVTLTPELRRSCPQIQILGMSSDAGKNAEMLRLGANLAVPKAALRRIVNA